MTTSVSDVPRSGLSRLTLEDQEIMLFTFEETEKLHDAGVVDTAHDLNLLEDVGALRRDR